jgi:tRNA (cytidine/uridine-2'-O-)-methyltransferase
MFEIVLYEPEIPPNTGNIIRLCANTGSNLHLVGKLGFSLDDKQLQRAGLDYHEYASLQRHECWKDFVSHYADRRWFAVTTKGSTRYDAPNYQNGDVFVFGPETRGLPPDMLRQFPDERQIRVPMLPHSRSLNLSNTVAVVVYEAWRQAGYAKGM